MEYAELERAIRTVGPTPGPMQDTSRITSWVIWLKKNKAVLETNGVDSRGATGAYYQSKLTRERHVEGKSKPDFSYC